MTSGPLRAVVLGYGFIAGMHTDAAAGLADVDVVGVSGHRIDRANRNTVAHPPQCDEIPAQQSNVFLITSAQHPNAMRFRRDSRAPFSSPLVTMSTAAIS